MPFERRIDRPRGRGLLRLGHLALELFDLAFEPRHVPPLVLDHFRLAFELCVLLSPGVLPVPLLCGFCLPTSEQKTGHDPCGRLEEFGAFDP
jgi:hypothetical protein